MGTAVDEFPQPSHGDFDMVPPEQNGCIAVIQQRNRMALMPSAPIVQVSSLNVFGEGFAASSSTQSGPQTQPLPQPATPFAQTIVLPTSRYPRCARGTIASAAQVQCADLSRTQHKLFLQRQSFLADDKNHLEHPENMRRLTKETLRINREYRCVRQFEDPLADSLRRVAHQHPLWTNSCSTSPSSSTISSLSWSSVSTSTQSFHQHQQQRRLLLTDFRRHSSTSVPSVFEKRHTQNILGRLYASLNAAPLPPSSRRHSQIHHII